MKKSITPQDICDFLNELFLYNKKTLRDLLKISVPLSDSSRTRAVLHYDAVDFTDKLKILGLLNGLFREEINENAFGPIVMVVDDLDNIKFVVSEKPIGEII